MALSAAIPINGAAAWVSLRSTHPTGAGASGSAMVLAATVITAYNRERYALRVGLA